MNKTAFLLVILVFITASALYGQKNKGQAKYRQLGVTFSSFGDNDVVYFQPIEGAASYNGDKFFTIGINYLHQLNKTFDIETGIEYAKHTILIDPFDPPYNEAPSHGEQFSLVNIPITARINFLKYCFVNGGFILDIDPTVSSPVDNQTGIGGIIGLGFNYDFKCGVSSFINPYIKAHSLIPFSADDQYQRLMESGIRFGIMYKLK